MSKKTHAGCWFWLGWFALALAACTQALPPTAEKPPVHVVSQTNTVLPSETQPKPTDAPCAYVWAEKDLLEINHSLAEAYRKAGLADVAVRAAAFGENCVAEDGQIVRFAARETDFYFTIPVGDTGDIQALGEWVEKVVPVLASFPIKNLPGTASGLISIRFTSPGGEKNIRIPRDQAEDLLRQGIRGVKLYEALVPR